MALFLSPPAAAPQAVSSAAGVPVLTVDYFGAEAGYAIGSNPIDLLCIVRNAGRGALPDHAVRLRCDALAGLDYTTGDNMPFLHALAANERASFHFRLQPTSHSDPLVAAIMLNPAAPAAPAVGALHGPSASQSQEPSSPVAPMGIPSTTISVIPRIQATPSVGPDAVAGPAPAAGRSASGGWVSNDRLCLRVIGGAGSLPLLVLATRQAGQWHTEAVASPLAVAECGEEGQLPWRKPFRWAEARTETDAASAKLTFTGTMGSRCRAQFSIQVQKDSSIATCRLRLAPQTDMRFTRIELPRLIGDRPAESGAAAGAARPDQRLAAAHVGPTTYGIAWPSQPPLEGWTWEYAAAGDQRPVLGAVWSGAAGGTRTPAGTSVELTFRIFALSPSGSVDDSQKLILP